MILKVNKKADINGTSLICSVSVSYSNLVKLFGRHNKGNYKTDAEWVIETPFGVGTIYNYKDGKNYLGRKEGLAIKDITDWHIGGKNQETGLIILASIEAFEAGAGIMLN